MRKYNQGVADSNRRRTKHGDAAKQTKVYRTWFSIKQRCTNPSYIHYHRYGGRGITLHPVWLASYEQFRADVGEPFPGATLDRIDNDKGYEPGNVRWATRKQQANNRSTNVYITHNGETRTLSEWATHLGYKYGLLASRWKLGLRGGELLAPPKFARGALVEFNGQAHTLPTWSKISGVPYATLVWRIKNNKSLL